MESVPPTTRCRARAREAVPAGRATGTRRRAAATRSKGGTAGGSGRSAEDHVHAILRDEIEHGLAPGTPLRLRILPPPLPLRPYALSLLWHPRFDADPAHLWLREKLLGAAKLVASDTHAHARTRLRGETGCNRHVFKCHSARRAAVAS